MYLNHSKSIDIRKSAPTISRIAIDLGWYDAIVRYSPSFKITKHKSKRFYRKLIVRRYSSKNEYKKRAPTI